MRNVDDIKRCRDKMQSCIDKLNEEISDLKKCIKADNAIQFTRRVGKLNMLKEYYRNQIIGISFCLNEDSKLNSFCESSLFKNEGSMNRYFYK